jgi:cysteine-rich repeat protein
MRDLVNASCSCVLRYFDNGTLLC